MNLSFPSSSFTYPTSAASSASLSSSTSAGLGATGASLGGIRGLMNQNNEMRVRFIQNGWLA